MLSTYVYKYVHPDYPWLYVGKADTSFEDRVYRHGKEGKFLPFLDEVKIYYIELDNKAQSRMVELYLIDKYKPYLNQMDKYEGTSLFELNLPEWKIYTKEFKSNHNDVSLIHWGKFPIDKRNLRKDNEILNNKLKEKDDEIANLRWKIIHKDDEISKIQKEITDDAQFYHDLLSGQNDIIQTYVELLSKWKERYEKLLANYNELKNRSNKKKGVLSIFKRAS